ncbi:MAG TPA: phage tail tape measure protein, partial [Ligilactobacillus acidipiscis]|nr:phage tail tape measure protein [Ligilactobacillus acidipiscis]
MADEVLGRMAIELDLKDSSFTKGLTGAKQATRNAMSEMKANMAVIGQTGSKYERLAMQGKGLTKALEAQKNEMRLLDKEYKNSLTSNGEQTRASAKYAQQANNARAKVEALNKQIVENAKATARAKVETTGWTGHLNTISKSAIAAGTKLTKFGDNFTKRVSAPIGAGFIYSAKQAIDFNSQIAALGPLLTNGGKLTAQYRSQLDQLASSSKKWSKQYGVSTNDINSGMGELIRKGYTAKQTLGAMPAILDATKASGDSFNDVMHVSTSVLEQFGLKTKSTAGTLRNTTRVTDTLTTIANRTSAGFKDMGDAMVYIGPSAHAAGISLEETAAMVGILSNKGIEGSQAGTALRGALTRLIKPSKQNVEGFKKLGINVEDFKKGTLTLPDMLDKIKNNTKGWTKEQRAAAVATAFGTEAQSGMNALISAGGGELRKYTKYAEDSAGSTKKIAESMNSTQAAKIKRFQQTLHVLSIDIGEKLLPSFEPILSKADEWINKFDNMSEHTQSLIVKAGLLAVALGPTASILGRIITTTGKFGAGIVKVKGYFAAVRAGKDAVDALGIGSKAASTGLSAVGNSAASSAGTVGALGSSFKLLNPYVLGATAAIAAGITVWELWGKKAYQSSQETGRWGSSVGKTADTALTKFKGTSAGIVDALTDMQTAGETSTKSLAKSFDSEFGQIEKSAKEHMDNVNKAVKGLDPNVQTAVEKSAQKTKKSMDATIADARSHYKIAETILKGHNGKVSELNDDQRIMLRNQQDAMAEDEIKVLGITGKKKKTIMAALNNDISGMTRSQRTNAMRELQDYNRDSIKSY